MTESTRELAHELGYEGTIDRRLVHRVAVAEVFLTSATRADEDTILVGAQLPRQHALHTDLARPLAGVDPLLVLEVCRQAAYVIVHRFHDVPLERSFALRSAGVSMRTVPVPLPLDAPAEVVVVGRIDRRFHSRDGTQTGIAVELDVLAGDGVLATCSINASWMPIAGMATLRRRARTALDLPATPGPCPPVERAGPESVNRRLSRNVVIGPPGRTGTDTWSAELAVDQAHPTFFDHYLDHVPGMLELEACRQLATAADPCGRTPTGLSARFLGFVELDLPATVSLRLPPGPDSGDAVTAALTVTQAGVCVLEGETTLEPC